MASKSSKDGVGVSRRGFLGGSMVAGAATLLTNVTGANAQTTSEQGRPVSVPPSAQQMEREIGVSMPPTVTHTVKRAASDLMVQVLRDLGIEYVALNPGSSFEGLQESLVNYGDRPNYMPEVISATHEASAVDMAHGYARAEGKPICALIQGTVGLQNASMAIYQAFHGQVPLIILAGNDQESFLKVHTGDDIAALVRPYTKWDAQPETLEETLEALQEAYRQTMTPPCAPVLVVLNSHIQKEEYEGVEVPHYQAPMIPSISEDDAREIAKGLVAARNPRISVGALRSPDGVQQAVRLAELVAASVETMATFGPMSFPQRHPLVGPGTDTNYDFHLGLEKAGAHVTITGPQLRDMIGRDQMGLNFGWKEDPNLKQGPTSETTLHYDAEASLPMIIAAVESILTAQEMEAIQARRVSSVKANKVARIAATEQAVEKMRPGWSGSPISLGRIYAELWPLIKDLDWCLASPSNFSGRRHADIWDHDRPYSYLGVYPAAALGYGLGASVGAGLAAKNRKRIVINIQGDGDFNYLPGAVWSAAHHQVPLLTIMHNNRAWHMEYMYAQYMAGVRGRGTDRAHIGTTFRDPYMDFAKLAQGYGMQSEGPISDPKKLLAALKRGVESVLNGEPYLIDVLTQPR